MPDMKSDLTISTIQTELFWEDKQRNLDQFQQKIEAIRDYTEVVVLPEMFSTGFSMNPMKFAEPMDGASVQWMKKIAANRRIILTGSLIIEENGHYFNRLIWMLPNGQCGFYNKRHLFGYAGEDKHYKAGNSRLIASVKGWKINLQVCYDLRFPVWARQARPATLFAEAGAAPPEVNGVEYDLLMYVANWPQKRSVAWTTLLRARAIENQAFVVGVNRIGNDGNNIFHSGDSMIVDPLGEIIYSAGERNEVHTVTLKSSILNETRDRLPFLKDADRFTIEI